MSDSVIILDRAVWSQWTEMLINIQKDVKGMKQKVDEQERDPNVFTHKEAALYLGYSTGRLHVLKNNHVIPFSQYGKKITYRKKDLDQFLSDNRIHKRKPT
ncbi:helix-turn-helix domain-containing protein [Dyadobacter bucti]|uniref:helix-turn-helix domain-containing protein n=1 Tax=Dyadobacter bucti TaxID=2572203 RepID=UPI001108DECC|nr:helix-turn-helix domain-containing protein [Dyadobacter bucti]